MAGTRIRVAAGTRPLDVEAGGEDVVEAIVPTWRRDLAIEGDVIEEIIRIRGYDTVPPTLPDTPMPHVPPRSAGAAERGPRYARWSRPDRGGDLRAGRTEAQ